MRPYFSNKAELIEYETKNVYNYITSSKLSIPKLYEYMFSKITCPRKKCQNLLSYDPENYELFYIEFLHKAIHTLLHHLDSNTLVNFSDFLFMIKTYYTNDFQWELREVTLGNSTVSELYLKQDSTVPDNRNRDSRTLFTNTPFLLNAVDVYAVHKLTNNVEGPIRSLDDFKKYKDVHFALSQSDCLFLAKILYIPTEATGNSLANINWYDKTDHHIKLLLNDGENDRTPFSYTEFTNNLAIVAEYNRLNTFQYSSRWKSTSDLFKYTPAIMMGCLNEDLEYCETKPVEKDVTIEEYMFNYQLDRLFYINFSQYLFCYLFENSADIVNNIGIVNQLAILSQLDIFIPPIISKSDRTKMNKYISNSYYYDIFPTLFFETNFKLKTNMNDENSLLHEIGAELFYHIYRKNSQDNSKTLAELVSLLEDALTKLYTFKNMDKFELKKLSSAREGQILKQDFYSSVFEFPSDCEMPLDFESERYRSYDRTDAEYLVELYTTSSKEEMFKIDSVENFYFFDVTDVFKFVNQASVCANICTEMLTTGRTSKNSEIEEILDKFADIASTCNLRTINRAYFYPELYTATKILKYKHEYPVLNDIKKVDQPLIKYLTASIKALQNNDQKKYEDLSKKNEDIFNNLVESFSKIRTGKDSETFSSIRDVYVSTNYESIKELVDEAKNIEKIINTVMDKIFEKNI